MSLKLLLGRQVPDCAIIGGGPVGLIFAILSSTSIGNVQIFESKEHDSQIKIIEHSPFQTEVDLFSRK